MTRKGPPPRFDHDGARRLRADGWKLGALAEKYGVSESAVSRVVNPRTARKMADRQRRVQRGGKCIDCGVEISRNYSRPALRCNPCDAINRATTVRDGELRCTTCKRWKPDDQFPRDQRKLARRWRHRECRACGTEGRRARRERLKVPCSGCGEPIHGPSEAPTGRCRRCSVAQVGRGEKGRWTKVES